MKNAVGYIRVSTEEQSSDDKYGIDVQKQAVLNYAQNNNYVIVRFAVDTISGIKDNRPEFDKILELTPDDGVDAVIVFKNDRVARDTKLYFYYFYTLEKRGISLLSTEEHFAEGDDFANIYRSLLMFVAEQERRNIALRTGKGRSIKANCGGYAGGRIPYGYKVTDGMLVKNPAEVPIVELIFREYDKNCRNMTEITEKLEQAHYKMRNGRSHWHVSSVKSILDNRKFYEGYYKYGKMKDWVLGVHERLL